MSKGICPVGTSEKTDDDAFFFAFFPFPFFPHFRLGFLITFPGAALFHNIFLHLSSSPGPTISEDLRSSGRSERSVLIGLHSDLGPLSKSK